MINAKAIEKKYVRVVKMGKKWNTYLQIDHQGFCVCQDTTKVRAKWFARMLSLALERLLKNEGAGNDQ